MKPTSRSGHLAGSAGACLLLFPTIARPATLDAAEASWLGGLVHPFAEMPHLGALLVLGIAAALLGGRSAWGLPLMFVGLTTCGLVFGREGAVAPMSDVILTTVLCFALLLLGKVHLVLATVASLLGGFALFHGLSDGYLITRTYADVPYVAGFLGGSLVVMAAGYGLADWIRRFRFWHEHHRPAWIDRMHGWHLGA
ncbi:HupE/UreJ family protein [Opitutus sp. ER46]|uniref:HupE/UreJ family protein n=1 Tax=Opitutus sp. ER46 TaxID=2161864 RepID=UPI001304C259|nr:HupE/UreJ family protein [Opitutus sp. ER46]